MPRPTTGFPAIVPPTTPFRHREGSRVTARVRLRGIYTTALARLLREDGFEVVQPSPSIVERFSIDAETKAYDATITSTDDRLGVGIRGDPETVGTLRDPLSTAAIDAFAWRDDVPREAVFDAVVTDTRSGGAVLDLGSREGYLPARAVDGDAEEGDRHRVQVREPSPPWSDDRPLLDTELRVDGGGLVALTRTGDPGSESGSTGSSHAGSHVGGIGDVTDLLPTDVPANWRARPTDEGEEASFDALDAALENAATRADAIDDALAAAGEPDAEPTDTADADDAAGTADTDDTDGTDTDVDGTDTDGDGGPASVWAGPETAWVRFGRASRFALDDRRRAVTATMAGHHRIKAGSEDASAAVDFAESVCGSAADGTAANAGDDLDFPFGVTTRQFGPHEGEAVAIAHGKPDGRGVSLGRGEVASIDPDGALLVQREMHSDGVYDAIGTERRAGDVAITRFKEGRWWYRTRYRGADGDRRGTYVNVCTPVEAFPDAVRYVDLYVDVVRRPDGEVERVDDDELDAAVADGLVGTELAQRARSTATAIERAL